MNVISTVDSFLFQYGMHPDNVIFEDFVRTYHAQMIAGLSGQPSSLKMIPTYLSPETPPIDGETVIAVDIGGTNLRVALTAVRNGHFEILESALSPVPGRKREITIDVFFEQIAESIRPIIKKSRRMGICFSHPVEIMPNGDGRLLSFSKEFRISNSEGVMITQKLLEKLTDSGDVREKKAVVLNDTAAILLSGAQLNPQLSSGMIGFVMGTGMNLSYVEQTADIKTLNGVYDKCSMIINTETGIFAGDALGALDQAFDATTANPGDHLLEKKVGGRYLGPLILFVLQQAARDGLLSAAATDAALHLDTLETSEAGEFLADVHGNNRLANLCTTDTDRLMVQTIADRLLERAAKLSVCAIAAILNKTNAGLQSDSPALIVAEGSTFYKLFSFRTKFNAFVQSLIHSQLRRYCQIVSVDDATLIGSAYAARTLK